MKKAIAILIGLAGFSAPVGAHAQVTLDMTKVTCADYLAMPSDMSRDFSAWMSGWFNQKAGYTFVDLEAFHRNTANVLKFCAAHPKDQLFGVLQASVNQMQKKQ